MLLKGILGFVERLLTGAHTATFSAACIQNSIEVSFYHRTFYSIPEGRQLGSAQTRAGPILGALSSPSSSSIPGLIGALTPPVVPLGPQGSCFGR